MLMPITYNEKNNFIKKSESIADKLLHLDHNDFEDTALLFKVLAHALRNNETLIEGFDESIFEKPELLKANFNVLLQHALSVATTSATTAIVEKTYHPKKSGIPTEYSPAQLGKYFGVSVTTIHNWIKQGRFVDVEIAGENKHNRISENTKFITSAGEIILVSEVVEMWKKQESEFSSLDKKESELAYYTRLIADYERKYGGEFQHTLGTKETLTPEEETDAQVWSHLLGRQKIEFGDNTKK